jgi:hypothetical protein
LIFSYGDAMLLETLAHVVGRRHSRYSLPILPFSQQTDQSAQHSDGTLPLSEENHPAVYGWLE